MPGEDNELTLGIARTLQTLIEIEKPVIARVNGDAIAFGSSLVSASDFIAGDEMAYFCTHMAATDERGRSRL